MYEEAEPVETADVLCKEWSNYCGAPVSAGAVKDFMTDFDAKDINNLYYHLEKNQPLKIPDSVKRNSLTELFYENEEF